MILSDAWRGLTDIELTYAVDLISAIIIIRIIVFIVYLRGVEGGAWFQGRRMPESGAPVRRQHSDILRLTPQFVLFD